MTPIHVRSCEQANDDELIKLHDQIEAQLKKDPFQGCNRAALYSHDFEWAARRRAALKEIKGKVEDIILNGLSFDIFWLRMKFMDTFRV